MKSTEGIESCTKLENYLTERKTISVHHHAATRSGDFSHVALKLRGG
jgi:hypothetical protein